MFSHILVPTDGSDLSRNAATRAIQLAKGLGARITFLHAKPERPVTYFFSGEGAFVDQTPPEDVEVMAQKQANSYLGALEKMAADAGVPCDKVTADQAAPYEAIIATARERGCDLILMASHGRRGVKGLILGSETQKVLTHSTIPVLVYR